MDLPDIIYRNNDYVANLHATVNNENKNTIFTQQFYTSKQWLTQIYLVPGVWFSRGTCLFIPRSTICISPFQSHLLPQFWGRGQDYVEDDVRDNATVVNKRFVTHYSVKARRICGKGSTGRGRRPSSRSPGIRKMETRRRCSGACPSLCPLSTHGIRIWVIN